MPFVAELDGQRIDLTIADHSLWVTIHRVALGDRLRCPECDGVVRAKQMSSTGTRFVQHITSPKPCWLVGESPAHRELKRFVIDQLRTLGWTADPEVAGSGWRADVLGFDPRAPDRTWVFEIQLSGQSDEETTRRTSVLSAAGHKVVWITRRRTSWFRRAPSWCVSGPDRVVTDGLWRWHARDQHVEQSPLVAFSKVLVAALVGQLIWHPGLRVADPDGTARLRSGRWPERHGDGGWATEKTFASAIERGERRRSAEAARAQQLADIHAAIAARPPRTTQLMDERPKQKARQQLERSNVGVATHTAGRDRDRELVERRRDAVERIMRLSTDLGWSVVRRPGCAQSYFGDILVVEGRLIVVEPTGVRQGRWPGAVVIGNPAQALRRNVDDVWMLTLDEWLQQPTVGSGDPATVNFPNRQG